MTGTEFLEVLKSRGEVELAVKRSGRWMTRPVWFVVDGATVYLLPVNGTDTKWYKHVTINSQIELSVRGKKVRGQARPLLDAQQLADVTNRFRSKYGELERFYRKLDVAIAVTI
jgi:hypothetical protein